MPFANTLREEHYLRHHPKRKANRLQSACQIPLQAQRQAYDEKASATDYALVGHNQEWQPSPLPRSYQLQTALA